ncbi:hypothetical protein [uncultured Treponema sp.]|uniref:hypothetical protein n=1 Tax=uncultured Treponema sp. TaxID=162155 RepID=UPI002596E015|nr:hypothetical protein [uncultured Treponema sp.]
MTDYKKFLIYIGTTLAIVLPFPGRIAYGIFALLHFNVSVVLLTLMFYAINLLNVKFLRLGICSLELVALTILYKQLLVIFCPVAALTIGFSFYLPAVSAVVITIFNLRIKNSIKESCLDKLKKSLSISAFCFIIFVLRDILGFGTITLPKWQSLLVIKIPEIPFLAGNSFMSFFATIPGCMVLTVLVFFAALKLNVVFAGEKNA